MQLFIILISIKVEKDFTGGRAALGESPSVSDNSRSWMRRENVTKTSKMTGKDLLESTNTKEETVFYHAFYMLSTTALYVVLFKF